MAGDLASNRTSDRSGVLRELMFIINRRGALNIEARLQPWLKWVETQRDHLRPHYLTVSFAQQHPNVVFRDTVPDGYDQFATPRSLCLMDKDLRAIRTEQQVDKGELLDLDDPIAHEMVGGLDRHRRRRAISGTPKVRRPDAGHRRHHKRPVAS